MTYCIGDAAAESASEYSRSRVVPSALRGLYCAIFDDFEPVDADETNAVEVESEFGAE
ncbi:hypothetical protein JCM31271_27320 [Halorubrum trueperi]